ncbi:hypothetical protein IPL85_03160 [Candidatus Saccharibacteria bacterium]|nr:MAG: hypothetical protein IPL85_03160 [Candidatus Saccharibacteria bacterium]
MGHRLDVFMQRWMPVEVAKSVQKLLGVAGVIGEFFKDGRDTCYGAVCNLGRVACDSYLPDEYNPEG